MPATRPACVPPDEHAWTITSGTTPCSFISPTAWKNPSAPTGVDAPSAELLEALLADLARKGRGILIATHDLDQALAWDRVLCLNCGQIAFGRPDETLTRRVLEETYGGAIVAVPEGEGRPARGILPAHHHEHGHTHE